MKKDIRFFFTAVKAAAILGIFSYHFYDFSYTWGSVGQRFSEGIR